MLTCMKQEILDGSGLQSEAKPRESKGIVRKWAALAAFLLLTVFAWSLATSLERVDCNSRKLPGKGGKSMDSVNRRVLGNFTVDTHSPSCNLAGPSALLRLQLEALAPRAGDLLLASF